MEENAAPASFRRYEDFRVYDLPDSLDDLHGPSRGVVALPLHLNWAPGARRFDLGRERSAHVVYRSVIAEGTVDDICRYLNKGLLVRLWPDLDLPAKAAVVWQRRFPELKGNFRGDWDWAAL